MENENVSFLPKTVLDFIQELLNSGLIEIVETEQGIVLVVGCLKGGVGKSAVAALIAHFLDLCGFKTLFVDGDSSGNSSNRFVPEEERKDIHKLSNVFRGLDVQPYQATDYLDVLIGTEELEEVKSEIDAVQKKVKLFRSWIFRNKLREQYDFIVVDTHNDKGWLNKALVYASDYVLGVTEPSKDGFKGLLDFEDFLEEMMVYWLDEETGNNPVNFKYGFVANQVPHNISTAKSFVKIFEEREDYLGYFKFRNIVSDSNISSRTIFDLTEEKRYLKTSDNYKAFYQHTMDTLKKILLDIVA